MKWSQTIFISILILFSQACYAQAYSGKPDVLSGNWLIELQSNDIGTVNTILIFESKENSFTGFTRKGADKAILGFWKSGMVRVFTNDFKNGSLIRFTDGIIQTRNDTTFLAAIFRSSIGNYYFNGTVVKDSMVAALINSKQEITGRLAGCKIAIIDYPLDDYPKIISEAVDTAKSKIFNRDILTTKNWKKFERKIKEKSTDFQDDIELVFAFYYFAGDLAISHFALTRIAEHNSQQDTIPVKHLNLTEISALTGLLKVSSFSGNPFGRIDQFIREESLNAQLGKISWEEADSLMNANDEFYEAANNTDSIKVNPYLKAWESFNKTYYDDWLSLDIPIYLAYGTEDRNADLCDIVPLFFIEKNKTNLTLKRYLGLEHNFFELSENGRDDHRKGHWNEVMNEFANWIKEKR